LAYLLLSRMIESLDFFYLENNKVMNKLIALVSFVLMLGVTNIFADSGVVIGFDSGVVIGLVQTVLAFSGVVIG